MDLRHVDGPTADLDDLDEPVPVVQRDHHENLAIACRVRV
jgi:hypothetical protein